MAKSWDIQPRRKAPSQPVPQQPAAPSRPQNTRPEPKRSARIEPMVRRAALPKTRPAVQKQQAPRNQPAQKIRRPEPEPVKPTVVRREHVPQGRSREPLKYQRKRARRRTRTVLFVSIFLAAIGALAALWLPAFRVQDVVAAGPNQEEVKSSAMQSLEGSYYYLFPHNSIFFFPGKDIRKQIISHYPDIAAVSISRTSLHSIAVVGIPREAAFLWCGEDYGEAHAPAVSTPTASSTDTAMAANASSEETSAPQIPSATAPCYNADGQGYIFSEAASSSTQGFRIYGALVKPDASPIGSQMAHAAAIPAALNFIKALKNMNVPVTSLVIRGDEGDVYTPANTRITYVLGKEASAQQLATAAFQNLNLVDGSVEYVDLRFDGKVYFKKVGVNAESD